MYDNDDIRFNRSDREPWELDTGSRFRQHFDNRRVEDPGEQYRERAEKAREAKIREAEQCREERAREAEEARQARDARHDRGRFRQTESDEGGTPPLRSTTTQGPTGTTTAMGDAPPQADPKSGAAPAWPGC